VLAQNEKSLTLEAFFNRDDMTFHGMLLKRGDRFVETYFADRWYNIYEIYDRDSNERKGWYCNVTRPAEIEDGKISYVDLALDLLVFPDKRQLILDEDEFAALKISPEEAQTARLALQELQALFTRHD
jgi:predicted RNA-binding protein associated with RNAse of E/G family